MYCLFTMCLQVSCTRTRLNSGTSASVRRDKMAADSLYCICRKPYDSLQFMIQCDSCEEWFHGSCVGIEEHQAPDIERYHCPMCSAQHGPLTLKKRRNWHRHDYSEIDDGSKAVQTGTVMFIKGLRNRKFRSDSEVVRRLKTGRELTIDSLENNGFNRPIFIEKKDGLGLVLPDTGFGVLDVERCVGPMRELDVIDVNRQEDYKMRMREWSQYYLSTNKKKTLNVISLEFSQTSLSQLVHCPLVVRHLDWANHVWPSDLAEDSPHKRPFVQKYCLMGVKSSYTDFHVDFGGTSVWYHVFKGEKTFYFVEPTKANLGQYEKWVSSAHQSELFFGDLVEKCYKCSVKQGQTLLIPTGWIHAVFTPVDSLVFGGNFLHSLNIELQLGVYEMELRLKTPEKFLHPFYQTMNWYAAVYLLDKLKAIHESGEKAPQHLVQGMQAMATVLKKWSTKGEEFHKHHKFFIPDGLQSTKFLKNFNKELKVDEKSSKTSKPSTPLGNEDERHPKNNPAVVIANDQKPRGKSKAPKRNAKGSVIKEDVEQDKSSYRCQVDDSKPVIRIANPNTESLPSLKLKLPKVQAKVESSDGKEAKLGGSADSQFKFVVSNGKIVSNNAQRTRDVSGKQFQPLVEEASPVHPQEGSYSCVPSQEGSLCLKLSMNSLKKRTKQGEPLHLNVESDSDFSDSELNFSVGGTPHLVSSPPTSTKGKFGTTKGLETTGPDLRSQHPMARMPNWNQGNASPEMEDIEAAKTLLFSLASSGAGKARRMQHADLFAPGVSRGGETTSTRKPSVKRGPTSRLNSKRGHNDNDNDASNSEDDDLGFGDSDYFKDRKYVYPPLAEMTDEADKTSTWKPGQKKKKSERVDATWNPKSKLVCSPIKESPRLMRQQSRRASAGPSPQDHDTVDHTRNTKTAAMPGPSGETGGNVRGLNAGAVNPQTSAKATHIDGIPAGTEHNARVQGKRGRQKTVTTTKQRLAKILKLDKTRRYRP